MKNQHIVYQHGRYKPRILEAEAGLSGILAQPELQSEMSVCVGGGGDWFLLFCMWLLYTEFRDFFFNRTTLKGQQPWVLRKRNGTIQTFLIKNFSTPNA